MRLYRWRAAWLTRRLTHVPVGWRLTQLLVHVRRFAPVREVPPLCRAVPSGATSTPAVIIDLFPYATRRSQRVCWMWPWVVQEDP